MNRCINEILGYCKGTPKGKKNVRLHPADGRPLDQDLPLFRLGTCPENSRTCIQYRSQSQITQELPAPV